MTKNDIVLEITKDKGYMDCCRKLCLGKDIYRDLFQYIVLYLLEMDEKKLKAIHSRGELKWFVVRIIYVNAKSPDSQFQRTFKDNSGNFEPIHQLPDTISEEDTTKIDDLLNRFDEEMDRECNDCIQKGVYPASVMLYHLYEKHGSYTEVAKCTRIPYKTVQRHVHSIREKVIKKINEDTSSNAT